MRIFVMELVRRPGYMKLSLHDDIESLDPESSGRRQRTGWRSRNASAFETWPNYGGSSTNQRGTSPNVSGISVSQQLSHRDNFYHPDQEIFGSHGWWVSPAATRQTRGRGTPNQRGAYTNHRGTSTNQRGTSTNQRGTHVNQRGTSTNQRGAHANQRGTTTNHRWTYANQRERGTYANQCGTNAYQLGTNANQRGVNANQRGVNANQRGTNANQRGSNANLRGMNTNQRGANANQRGVNANQRAANANQRGANANQRETNANQRTFPYLRGNQRGANANQRAPASQRGIPNNQRAPLTSPRQANQAGAQANQRGLPSSQWSRSRLPETRGGLSLSSRDELSCHRGTNVIRGRCSLEHLSPERRRETSPQRMNRLCNKLWPFKPQQPKVPEQSPRRLWIPCRASVSDSALGQAQDNLALQHGASAAQRRIPLGQRWSLSGRRRSPEDQRWSLSGRRQSPEDQCGSPEDRRGSPVGRRRTPEDRRGSPPGQRGSPLGQRGSPVGRRESPSAQHRSPVDQRESAVKKREPIAVQHKIPQQVRLNPKVKTVKFEKPPQMSWLKKLVARGRSKISPDKIKRKAKADKGKSTAKSKQETKQKEIDTPTPGMIEELHLPPTDAEGLDPKSLMFRDGHRRIDMVIAFKEGVGRDGQVTEAETSYQKYRRVYQENLIKEGLELELEHESLSFNGKTWFLKVHIPWATQLRMAEVIGLKLPTKKLISISVKTLSDQIIAKYQKKWYVRLHQCFYKIFELTRIKPEPSFHKANHNYRREEQFLVKDRHTEFSPAQRSLLVMQILLRAKYGEGIYEFGINRLLAAQAYVACFPLHEGEYYKSKQDGTYTDRQLLYLEWARGSAWYKRQPLWLIQRYFGDQIGLYYAWLGFYTKMLIAPAVVGSLCFLYGLASSESKDNIPSKEICDTNGVGNITLCPLCDKACSYQKMYEACIFAQLTYLIDNPATVFFAVFMSFWATTFLVLWKREESVIRWQWDLASSDPDERPRPEYEASVTTTRINPITGEREPYRSPWQNFIRRVAVSTAVFTMIAISICTVLGIITYRIAMVAVIYRGSGGILRKYARLFTILTAAMINLAVSELLIKIFTEVALVITNLENPRTQTDYEDSVTFKMFIFEFINFYATIVYIAFFKGSFYDHPGDKEARKSPFLTIKGDICFQAGCLSELSIMLGVSMIGKQTCHNIKEMGLPVILNWWRSHSHRSQTLDLSKPYTAWEQDYHLQDPGHMALYEEYLEMIMQYGFVTLFVAAFPLGPLCALINNICEIRMDAYKMVTQARRPLPVRVEDIGAWYGVLRFLTYLAVVSNAFVLAYTSDFIPRLVYRYAYSPTGTLEGYVNHSLSWFNTSDFQADWGADDSEWDPPECAYRGYRNPPDHPKPYGLSPYFWHVFAARLIFVVLFEHLVFTMTEAIHAIIPKVPTELLRQIRREKMLEKELRYKRNQNSTDVEYLKSRAEGRGLRTVKTDDDAGVTINWRDEASKKAGN